MSEGSNLSLSGARELGLLLEGVRARVLRAERAVDLIVASAVVLAVGAPMLFTHDGYSQDFTNAIWLVWVSGHHFGHSLWPSYFLSVNGTSLLTGVFEPEFAFYGGPLYAAAGALSALLVNHAVAAFEVVTTAAMAGAYGGCWWLARQCGVRGLLAHVPAVLLLTSSYYITDLYGRGAWAEFMAVSSMPLMLASAVDLVRAARWRLRSVLMLVVSVFFFTGSHNITLEWGTIVLGLVAIVTFLAYRPSVPVRRRIAAVGCLGLVAAGINGWFLLPDIAYAGRTAISGASFEWGGTSFFNTVGVLLNPLRTVPARSATPALYAQAPVWFMAWGLIVGIWLWRDGAMGRLRRAWAIAALGVATVLALMLLQWPWEHMPHVLLDIQFPYRLGSYVTILSVGVVIVAAAAVQRLATRADGPARVATLRSLRALLVVAVTASSALALWQLWVPKIHQSSYYADRDEVLRSTTTLPKTWGSGADYADNWAPTVSVPDNRSIDFDARAVSAGGDRISLDVAAPPGLEPIATNILAGPYLVEVSGVRVVGRAGSGLVVTRLNGSTGKLRMVVQTRSSRAVALGRAVSVVSLLALLSLFGWLAVGKWRDRGRPAAQRIG